tara:strand:+ start:111 stop:515 length:405 start_codon:yes stop_codon:yes gene_type:complete
MGNTLNYYRDMKETLLDQRKKRIGRNDFKRSMNAKRDTDRVSLLLLGAAIIFVLGSTVSADERIPSSNYEDVLDIEPRTSPRAESWKRNCIKYFQFREPRIVVYKDLAPTVWCMVESQKILRGEIPFDYKKDTK